MSISTYFVTFFPDLERYSDRLDQLVASLPENSKLIVVTHTQSNNFKNHPNITLQSTDGGIFQRGPFLKVRLMFLLLKLCRNSNVYILDWFLHFNYSFLLRPLFRNRVTYIYAPVISNYGWLHKRLTGEAPYAGFRYDWLRARNAIQDWIAVKLCDYLLVQSDELQTFYSQVYDVAPTKILVNYNALSSSKEGKKYKIPPIKQHQPFTLGFIGNLERHKGLVEMTKIISRLERTSVHLKLAGRCNGTENEKLLSDLTKLSNVIYEGAISPNQVLGFYESVDALLLLSYHEGSPRVIREFLTHNKPIFACQNPGLDYCRGLPGIHLYQYGEVEKVVSDIEQLLEKASQQEYWQELREREIPVHLRREGLKEALARVTQ